MYYSCYSTSELLQLLSEEIRKEWCSNPDRGNLGNIDSRLIKHRIDELLYREEMIWLQRFRVAWLKEGDRNTKYFRQQVKWRAQKNKIRKLYRLDGSWCENQKDMQNMARQFF
jgi:hypothetical protein